MITFQKAFKQVLAHPADFGTRFVSLMQSVGQVLAEDITADRDFPPFDRSTKDGIALSYSSFARGIKEFDIIGIAPAGEPLVKLSDKGSCVEIMTGAVVPEGADTVVMYEEVEIRNGKAYIPGEVKPEQNVHHQGVDEKAGDLLLPAGRIITPEVIGVLATVGKAEVKIRALPKVLVVSTGNELVAVEERPKPHQIRRSNVLTLQADLDQRRVKNENLHLPDQPEAILSNLEYALKTNDVILLSGGVSKGKFDHIPESLEKLGVKQVFHKVYQRPGKPFWFGYQEEYQCTVFSFPGNPVSTWACYRVYFIPWLEKNMGLPDSTRQVRLAEPIEVKKPFTRLMLMNLNSDYAVKPLDNSGSGDLTALVKADGIVVLSPGHYAANTQVTFYAFR